MLHFTATIKKFDQQGEKTGWTYIDIPVALAQQLIPGNKKSFRVKGKLDSYVIERVALVPMGGGGFIMALNTAMRKAIGKGKGATLQVQLEVDTQEILPPADLIECLQDEPAALANYYKLPPSHRHYFTRWISEAKTETTRAKRIAITVNALVRGTDFGAAMRAMKEERGALGL
jgi:hypothetical protein